MANLLSLDLPDADVLYCPAFIPPDVADRLLAQLLDGIDWRQEKLKMYGREIPFPRLTAWHGDPGTGYVYSGVKNVARPWTPPLLEIKRAVDTACATTFNTVLLNRYRTGQDSVSWHADDEPEFGPLPVIASVSLGGTRTFKLKHKQRQDLKASVELTHGSLLVMSKGTQEYWLHQVPKTKQEVPERLNLTFRVVRGV